MLSIWMTVTYPSQRVRYLSIVPFPSLSLYLSFSHSLSSYIINSNRFHRCVMTLIKNTRTLTHSIVCITWNNLIKTTRELNKCAVQRNYWNIVEEIILSCWFISIDFFIIIYLLFIYWAGDIQHFVINYSIEIYFPLTFGHLLQHIRKLATTMSTI